MGLVYILVAGLAGFYSGIMLCAILMTSSGNTDDVDWEKHSGNP